MKKILILFPILLITCICMSQKKPKHKKASIKLKKTSDPIEIAAYKTYEILKKKGIIIKY